MKLKRILLPVLGVVALISVRAAVKGDFALVRDTEIMVNMLRALNENYVDSLSTTKLLRDATNGMSRNLDPYTNYIDESEMADFEIMTTGKYGGIGAIIRQNGDYVTISQPYKGSPADEGGLLIGDRILEIDGVTAKSLTTSEVSNRLKGTPGSKVKLLVGSVIDSAERKVTLKRRRIAIPSVPIYDIVTDGVGYIKHTDFIDGCSDEMRAALTDLQSRGMRSLILDYRSNGGGVMQEAIKVLSLFVPKGSEVLKIKGRRDSTIYKTADVPLMPDIPMVVLVDEGSASAAEIVAGALQDMDRAVLIGQRSFGKGLVQSTIPVGYDSYLKLTTARYYIPSGRCIQAVDYTDHSDDRKVVRVADSLRREFYTLGGRKVLDGGGVTPDVEMEAEYVSRFAATLYAQGLIEEWGESYYRKHYREPFDPASFEIEESDYVDFAKFISTREVKYESQVSRAIKALEMAAEADRNEELSDKLKEFKADINDDVEGNLERYKEEIKDYMKQDIILRFSYLEGVLKNSLFRDKEVKRACEILSSRMEMATLLSPNPDKL